MIGDVAPGDILHGDPVSDSNLTMLIKEIIQREATTWFPDKFGDDTMCFVAWPNQSVTIPVNFLPCIHMYIARHMYMYHTIIMACFPSVAFYNVCTCKRQALYMCYL